MFSHWEISDSRRKYVTQPSSHEPGHPVCCVSLTDLMEHFRVGGLVPVNHALGLPLLSHPERTTPQRTHTHTHISAVVLPLSLVS